MFGRLIARDLRRSLGSAAWLPVAFFLLVATLVPFAVGPDAKLLARIGGGVLWIAALTAALLPIERLVEPDRADGVLDQLTLAGLSEELVALAKLIAHWLTFGPLLMVALLPATALLSVPSEKLLPIAASLALGTLALAAVAVAVASLTAGLRGVAGLAGLLLLPVAVPLLIFGAAAANGDGDALKLEAAVALVLVAGAPFVSGAALRASRT